ncbi:unnamed protein product [Moneuplotes crassus]|uniref:Uncharacterized protein n=1 Tax=Euplotes crassus TaxID=5936 RepID=A0AAD1X6G0_EUPCR|nr:unnamed protein product [Moneuplotes crassus]
MSRWFQSKPNADIGSNSSLLASPNAKIHKLNSRMGSMRSSYSTTKKSENLSKKLQLKKLGYYNPNIKINRAQNYFFEMFKKSKHRCDLLIPHTIFLSNETISEWYFTSKSGKVLRKNLENLKIMEVFKALLRVPEFTYAVNEIQSLKTMPFTDESYILQQIEKAAQENPNDSNIIAKLYETYGNSSDWNSTRYKFQTDQSMNSTFYKWNNEPTVTFTVNKIIKNCKKATHDAEINILDSTLPPIAYVRLEVGESRLFRPHEFYKLITESLDNIRVIQSLVCYKGSIQPPYCYSTYICEYKCRDSTTGDKFTFYKGKVSLPLEKRLKIDRLSINSSLLKEKLNMSAKQLRDHFEKAYQAKLVYAKFKFIHDVFGKIYYIGATEEIFYLPNLGINNIKIKKIIRLKSRQKKVKTCFGQFCDYRKYSEEETFQFDCKNFNNQLEDEFYEIFGALIKKAHDQPVLVNKLLERHKFLHKDEEPSRFAPSASSEYSRTDTLYESRTMLSSQTPSEKKLPTITKTSHFKRRFNLKNYHSFYRVVKVCRHCYQVYTMLTDYFNEIENLPKKGGKRARSQGAKRSFGDFQTPEKGQDTKLSSKKAFLIKTLSQAKKRRKSILLNKPPLPHAY